MAAIGELFAGRYELQSLLGRGGMAEVFAALDHRLGRRVAVKVLSGAMLSDPRSIDRFDREARTAASLNHRHVVNTYDAGSVGDSHYIVMELLEGPTLTERMADGPLPVAEALTIAADVAGGLAAAHERGLVHHDVKPSNVLFDREGTPKVTDFGIARAASSAVTTVMGTPAYLAPEQAMGGTADPRSDVYALGCVLFEMLAGRPPFSGDNASAIIAQHADADRPLLRDVAGVPAPVSALVARMMAIEPAERPATAGAARDQLARLSNGLAVGNGTMLLDADATAVAGAGHEDLTIVGYADNRGNGADATAVDGGPYDRMPPDDREGRRFPFAIVAVLLGVAVLVVVAIAALTGGTVTDEPSDAPVAVDDGLDTDTAGDADVTDPDAGGDTDAVDPGEAPDAADGDAGPSLLDRLLGRGGDPAPADGSADEGVDGGDGAGDGGGDGAGDGGGLLPGLSDRIDDLIESGRNADDVIRERVEESIREAIRERAEEATDQQVDQLRQTIDDAVDNGQLSEQVGEQLRDLLDDAAGRVP